MANAPLPSCILVLSVALFFLPALRVVLLLLYCCYCCYCCYCLLLLLLLLLLFVVCCCLLCWQAFHREDAHVLSSPAIPSSPHVVVAVNAFNPPSAPLRRRHRCQAQRHHFFCGWARRSSGDLQSTLGYPGFRMLANRHPTHTLRT
jgi:hypothetical protein